MVTYQVLTEKEIQEDLFRDFQRRQEVTRRLEKTAEGWTVREDRFVEDWGPEEYQILVRCLRHTAASGGLVLGAFSERKLKGFVSVEGAPAGSRGQYLELSSLHVSRELRGQGIGAALFEAARRFAWERGIGRLYISAHPAARPRPFTGPWAAGRQRSTSIPKRSTPRRTVSWSAERSRAAVDIAGEIRYNRERRRQGNSVFSSAGVAQLNIFCICPCSSVV